MAKRQRPSWIKWLPIAAFGLTPIVLITIGYLWPGIEKTILALGLLLAAAFVVFLVLKKKSELGVIAAVIPNVVGPFLSEQYVEHQVWPQQTAVNLLSTLHSGGDLLIQIAFFFASLVAMAVYLGSRVTKGRSKDVLSYCLFVVILFAMVGWGTDFFLRPFVAGDGVLPNVTLFFIGRVLIALNGIALSTWPDVPSTSN